MPPFEDDTQLKGAQIGEIEDLEDEQDRKFQSEIKSIIEEQFDKLRNWKALKEHQLTETAQRDLYLGIVGAFNANKQETLRLIADKLVVDDDELKQELLAPGNSFRGRGSSPAGSSTNKH